MEIISIAISKCRQLQVVTITEDILSIRESRSANYHSYCGKNNSIFAAGLISKRFTILCKLFLHSIDIE